MKNEIIEQDNNRDLFDLSLGYKIDINENNLINCDKELKLNSKIIKLRKVSKIVFDKDEDNLHKLTTIFNTINTTSSDLIYILQNKDQILSLYIGVTKRSNVSQSSQILHNIFTSNFNGCQISKKELKNDSDEVDSLLGELKKDNKITMATSIPSLKDDKEKKENFIQGLEKFLIAMQNEDYTTILLAKHLNSSVVEERKSGYEDLYSSLYPFSSKDINFGINNSYTDGSSESFSKAITKTTTKTFSQSISTNKPSILGKVQMTGIASVLGIAAGGAVFASGGGMAAIGYSAAAAGVAAVGIGGTAGAINHAEKKQEKKNKTNTSPIDINSENLNKLDTEYDLKTNNLKEDKSKWWDSENNSTNYSHAESEANTETTMNGTNTSTTRGSSEQISLKIENKYIKNQLDAIDMHLERIKQSQNYGMFDFAAYFISDDTDLSTTAANIYNSLIQGEKSYLGNNYIIPFNDQKSKEVSKYLLNFEHPKFKISEQEVSISSMINSKELAIAMNLPKKSIRGLPVKESVEFAKEIIVNNKKMEDKHINIGNIFSLGKEFEGHPVNLPLKDFTMHTLVTGSTGSGKSTTAYKLLNELKEQKIKFLVIEPTKGEYKHIFGNETDVSVYGTNNNYSELLQVNPFSFPYEEIHVLEHIDRLVEIFNACWSMYDAMPAVLKDAILKSYEDYGWDLDESTYKELFFPTFEIVLSNLNIIMDNSQYSEEVKSNYKGALSTRLESLTKGLIGKIFNEDEISDEDLFNENVIIDISRVGSSETKSLIMGILLLKLNQYRLAKGAMNSELKHITVLEEAHHLLPRVSTEVSSDAGNVKGKAVEMLSNSIAEMRTYGEGFIIVDQSPNMLDISAIRNTNTKIIMRLSELEDRNDIGKSATLNEDQINEIPKLEQGVAVVYQNGWEESILCKIQKSKIENQTSKYKYTKSDFHINKKEIFSNIVKIITLKNENVITKDLDELLNHFNGNKDIYRMWSSKNKIKAEAIEFINNIESKDISEKINIINKLFKANKLFNNYKSFSNEENKMNIFNYLNSHLINASDAILNIIYRDIIIANLEQEKQLKHIEALRIELNNERVK